MPLTQPSGDMCRYDKLYDLRAEADGAKLRAGSKEFDVSTEDLNDLISLCEQINAAERIVACHPWKMLTRFDGAGALGKFIIVFDDGNAACADSGPQEIPQRLKELEKKYTPADEHVIDGAWKCSCGQTNTGKFCMECGLPSKQ